MDKSDNILSRINDNMKTFSKGQKRIAQFIAEQYDKAAYITALKLGKSVGVSESTVVRFARELGYDGYPDMQKALRAIICTQLTAAQRVGVATDRIGENDILKSVLDADMENIRLSLNEIDRVEFAKIADAIVDAKRVYILGVRSSASLASFLSFYFEANSNICVSDFCEDCLNERLFLVGQHPVRQRIPCDTARIGNRQIEPSELHYIYHR